MVVALAGIATFAIRRAGSGDAIAAPLAPLPPPSATLAALPDEPSSADFVGAERCASCHRAEYQAWQRSTHGTAGGAPGAVRVLGPFDGTPIRFRDATVIPTASGGRYAFTVRQPGLPDRVLRVDGVIGGGHMEGGGTQGFVTRYGDGTFRFLPFDYSRHGRAWFCNTATRTDKGWVAITSDMSIGDCGDWPPSRVLGDEPRYTNCQGCHGSQIDIRFDTAAKRWDTRFTSLAVNCESCHGPGRRHIDLVASGGPAPTADIGMTALATLSKDQSLGVCLQCHAVKDHIAPNYLPGKPLAEYYSILLPQLGEAPHFPDGRVRTFSYQQGHLWSDCYVSGSMTCTSCHDPHSQGYRDANGTALTGRFADGQCTACHQSKAERLEAHTRHQAASAGSRCVSCHMPYLQEPEIGQAVRYARSDHSIPVPRPSFDSTLGIASACKLCHQSVSEAELDAQVRTRWGALKPHAPAVDAAIKLKGTSDRAEAARLALDPPSRHRAAQFAGLAEFLDRFLQPDMGDLEGDVVDRLQRLATSSDPDIRAASLAALHYARGQDRAVRRFLADQMNRFGADDRLLRARWSLVLGYFGDRALARGDGAGSLVAYQKALEVTPRNARLLLNLGLAHANAGNTASAIDAYRRSLEIDPRQPLALVNLGIAYENQNEPQQAAAAYRQAIAINPGEAIAFFNLGNVYLRASDPRGAIPQYLRAAELDPGITLANVYLARAYAAIGDMTKALAAVRQARAFAPNDDQARALEAELVKAGAR